MTNTFAARTARMTDADLSCARLDCFEAAKAMDELDRLDGQDRAGKYRDEGSAYAAEQARRAGR